ncbi:hypothetical protein GGX14DRAFT_555340 [Mycena pura]|uniref:F-box domain-containing protein n=1 Tax=Mycena pura TaxID=153505 RepID=A0AAD6YQN7_9AGAR|nr:hypothetical protein GGX14DRAFT_555340 [Mycena pura]
MAAHLSPSTVHSVMVHDSHEEFLKGSLADYVVNSSVLAPLLCFANLTTISLCPPAGFDIDDTTAWDLARTWPKLECLMLKPSVDWRHRFPPIHMTLHGLRAFAEHCKRLEELTIHVNATEVPPLDDSTTRVSPDICVLNFFNVGASPISDPPAVARFLFALFPDLLDLETSVDDTDWDDELGWAELPVEEGDDPEETAFERSERSRHAKWREVAKLLYDMPAFAKALRYIEIAALHEGEKKSRSEGNLGPGLLRITQEVSAASSGLAMHRNNLNA